MRFEFGDCELDTDRYELRRGDAVQRVEPQVFEVLALLVRERGRVVSKQELFDAVWGSRFVSESALSSRVKAARRAIGDDGRSQRLIRTVHGRGYQFVADVTEVTDQAPGPAPTRFRLDAADLLERDEPLAALGQAYDAAVAGRGGVVLVTGEPGIGKTALVSRFATQVPGGRVLWGACDDLLTPKPLGPLRDLTGGVSTALAQMIADGAAPYEIHGRLLAELSAPDTPTVLVIEDVHWADGATPDAVTVVGRRIGTLPAVLVLTFRAGDVTASHPLHATLAAIRPAVSHYLELAPLTRSAVEALAGDRADEVYALTGGTPFYVTELLAAEPDTVPPTVVHAVLGRAARLGDSARRLVELVSIVPTRTSTAVLDVVLPSWPDAAEEPERWQLLQVGPEHVRFRHELSRNAILSNLPEARRRRLHTEVLEALVRTGADPADVVHHAEVSGALQVAADYALVAARRAAAVGAHREAYSQFVRASRFADRLPLPGRAGMFEELAMMAYMVVRMPEAFEALDRAIEIYRTLADLEAVGRCTRIRSTFYWYTGDGDASMVDARAAVAILEPLGETAELARAYSGLSQLAMLASRDAEALAWGDRAVELATRLGDDRTRAHALVNIGAVRVQADVHDVAVLEEAYRLADATGDRHEAVRALLSVGYTAMTTWIQPGLAWRYTQRAIAYATEYQVDTLLSYLNAMTAWQHVKRGEFDTAERIALDEAETGGMGQLLARIVLAELAVRRGDPDTPERLAGLAEQADRTGELQRIVPVLAFYAEWSLVTGAQLPLDRFERAVELAEATDGWWSSRSGTALAGWATVAGLDLNLRQPPGPAVYAAMVRRDWRSAANAFGEVGWMYDRALMLPARRRVCTQGGAGDSARARYPAAGRTGHPANARAPPRQSEGRHAAGRSRPRLVQQQLRSRPQRHRVGDQREEAPHATPQLLQRLAHGRPTAAGLDSERESAELHTRLGHVHLDERDDRAIGRPEGGAVETVERHPVADVDQHVLARDTVGDVVAEHLPHRLVMRREPDAQPAGRTAVAGARVGRMVGVEHLGAAQLAGRSGLIDMQPVYPADRRGVVPPVWLLAPFQRFGLDLEARDRAKHAAKPMHPLPGAGIDRCRARVAADGGVPRRVFPRTRPAPGRHAQRSHVPARPARCR